jgi:hypothetical protein
MATRTIVTSQPDVACDVCARRLLRGEQPDTFIAAGRRLTVCELCSPRATHEGWLREADHESLTLPQMRPRRGRSLIDRLRQVGRPTEAPAANSRARAAAREEQGSYDILGGYEEDVQAVAPEPLNDGVVQELEVPLDGAIEGAEPEPQPAPEERPPYLEEALAVFNESEFPRRVAGVSRSLGAPVVNARSAEHLASVVRIVVAWELCWYRYEVDLSVEVPVAQVLLQGTELAELSSEEQDANASALPSGLLALGVL